MLIINKLIVDCERFTRFTEQIIKTLSPIQNKHILFLKIRYKYNYIFR